MSDVFNPVISFVIPGRLPSLNVSNRRYGSNKYAGSREKKKLTRACATWAIASGIPVFKKPVHVRLTFFEPNRRRDHDNIFAGAKYVMDGLVSAGRLKNDSQKWVVTLTPETKLDKTNPRIQVDFMEAA